MQASFYDLSPAGQLLLIGGLAATLVLTWILRRERGGGWPARWRLLTRLLLVLTFDLVLFGAFTRLTDSGLGCPDWPGCYGNASPLGARHEINAAQAVLPDGPVTHGKAWIEMVHRYLATSLGALITVAMLASWWLRRRDHTAPPAPPWPTAAPPAPPWPTTAAVSPGLATAAFVWVCVQGAFGALTVTLKLYPAIVTLHLLGGYAGLALLTLQAHDRRLAAVPCSAGLRRAAWAVLALIVVQSALGGWVSTNYAVLACSEFPRCQGSWWPPMDFGHGFTLLRDLGQTGDGQGLPFAALTAIHYTHRLAAYVVLASMAALAWALHRHGGVHLRRYAQGLAALAAWQFASGLSNVVLGWPLLAALAHTGGAGAAIVLMTHLLARTRAVPAVVAPLAPPLRPGAPAGRAAQPR